MAAETNPSWSQREQTVLRELSCSLIHAGTDRLDVLAQSIGLDVKGDFAGASLIECDLRDLNLRAANFRYSNLSGANLAGADLTCADLMGSDLSRADLTRATLCRADLSGAKLKKANLSGANLVGAKVSAQTDMAEICVRNAIIGKNPGLTQTRKNELLRKDAIPIKVLQRALKKHRFFSLPVDGNFGPETSQALEAFQRSQHLTPTGWVDDEVRKQLLAPDL